MLLEENYNFHLYMMHHIQI